MFNSSISQVSSTEISLFVTYEKNIRLKLWYDFSCVTLLIHLHYEADTSRLCYEGPQRDSKIDRKRIRTYRGDEVDLKCEPDEKFLAAVEECNAGSRVRIRRRDISIH